MAFFSDFGLQKNAIWGSRSRSLRQGFGNTQILRITRSIISAAGAGC